jgi:hemolysin-activating ACP:hemolysin acyltransferase
MLWARVSAEVDTKLRAQIRKGLSPLRLAPADWNSGDIVWIVDIIAPPEIGRAMVRTLADRSAAGAKRFNAPPGLREMLGERGKRKNEAAAQPPSGTGNGIVGEAIPAPPGPEPRS